MVASFQGEFIRPPSTEEEITFTLTLYEAINLPGCIGSTDGIQIPWANVPHAIREMYKGKGGRYSIGYSMTVSRDLYCQSIGFVYAGSHNDIIKAAFDPCIQRVRTDPTFKNRKFKEIAADDSTVEVTGVYLRGDRGCPRYEMLQQPAASSSLDPQLVQLNELFDASRKDVERFFGVLKSRWRILKTPIHLRDVSDMDDMMKCCVVLHNWYLLWRRKHQVTVPGRPLLVLRVIFRMAFSSRTIGRSGRCCRQRSVGRCFAPLVRCSWTGAAARSSTSCALVFARQSLSPGNMTLRWTSHRTRTSALQPDGRRLPSTGQRRWR